MGGVLIQLILDGPEGLVNCQRVIFYFRMHNRLSLPLCSYAINPHTRRYTQFKFFTEIAFNTIISMSNILG